MFYYKLNLMIFTKNHYKFFKEITIKYSPFYNKADLTISPLKRNIVYILMFICH